MKAWRWLPVLGAIALLVGPVRQPSVAETPAEAACHQLAALALAETRVTHTEVVASGGFTPPSFPHLSGLPPFCRVSAVVAPAVGVEVWLPWEGWNGRFLGVGGGGFAGVMSWAALAVALKDGYAAASTDTGHSGGADAAWAIGHPELVEDFGYRAVHEMTVVGKAVAQAYYGAPPRHAYWTGCSTGGRQGLMEAQRYPSDYDGILSGAPAIDWTALHAAQLWNAQATLLDPAAYLAEDQLAAVHAELLQEWDGVDGVVDGVIDDPSVVRVDVGELQRAVGLTDTQAAALAKLYAGPPNSVYPGLAPGGETLWQPVVGGPGPFPIGQSVYRDMVKGDPQWGWATLNYDQDIVSARARFADVLDTLDADLSPFAARGGKLLLYHGQADQLIQAERTRQYFEDVVRTVPTAFARLFLIGGMGHCRGGAGTDTFDGLGALVQWVEGGIAPDRLVAMRLVDGRVDRTRPLCPYPLHARWTGQGSTDDEANFGCTHA